MVTILYKKTEKKPERRRGDVISADPDSCAGALRTSMSTGYATQQGESIA